MRFIISLSIVLIAFDATKIRRIKQALYSFTTSPIKSQFRYSSQSLYFLSRQLLYSSSFAYEATRRGCSLNLQCGSKRCKPELNHTTDVTEKCKATQSKELEENISEDIKKTRYEINIANIRYI